MTNRQHFRALLVLAPFVFVAIPLRCEDWSPVAATLWTLYAVMILVDYLEGVR